jgi:hypothetical protein
MGNKNAKLNDRSRPLTNSYSSQSITNGNHANTLNSNDLSQFKLRKKQNYLNSQTAQNGSHTINRSCSSPAMASKWRPNSINGNTPQIINGAKRLDVRNNEFNIEYNNNILPSSPFKLRANPNNANANKINLSNRDNNNYVNYNQEMRTKQKDLTNIIKKIDSNQPSYHLSSKLYKPNSFIAAKSQPQSNSNNIQQQQQQHSSNLNLDNKNKLSVNNKKLLNKPTSSMSPSPNSSSASSQSSLTASSVSPMHLNNNTNNPQINKAFSSDSTKLPQQINNSSNKMNQLQVNVDDSKQTKQVRISPKVMVDSSSTFQNINDDNNNYNNDHFSSSNSKNTIKSKSSSKLAKKFGISPKLKRKLVETIANRVKSNLNLNSTGDNQSNNKFNQV